MKVKRIEYYKELSRVTNNYITLIRGDIVMNDYSSAYTCYCKALKIIEYYFNSYKITSCASDYFVRRIIKSYYGW